MTTNFLLPKSRTLSKSVIHLIQLQGWIFGYQLKRLIFKSKFIFYLKLTKFKCIKRNTEHK